MTRGHMRSGKYALLPSADLSYDSGSVVFAKQLANFLAAQGAEVHVLAKRGPSGVQLDSRVTVHLEEALLEHPIVTDRMVGNDDLERCERVCEHFLRRIHSHGAIDLVYAQYLSFTSAAATAFGRSAAVPVVVSSFGRDIDVGMRSDARFYEFASRSLPGIDAIIVPSSSVENKLKHFASVARTREPPIIVVPPPIDEEFLRSRASGHLPAIGEPLIATINSCFKPDKGIETIIEATARLREEGYANVHLAIAGTDDHPEELNLNRLKGLIEHFDLAHHITFLGYLSRDGVNTLLHQATVFVDARSTSGFSSVLVEAMACGAAICCSRNDASLALVRDGENGLLFPPGSADKLLAHMRDLLQDANFTSHMRTNAKRWFDEEGQVLLSTNAFTNLYKLLSDLAVPP